MKKIILILMIFLGLLGNIFSFDLVDSSGDKRVYFSFQDDFVKVVTEDNVSFMNINYQIEGVNKSTNYSFFNCEDDKLCVTFFLKNLAQNENYNFVNSLKYEINVLNEKKEIYLDLIKPELNVTNISVNIDTKKINLDFTYEDDLKVNKVELYSVENGSEVLISDVSSVNNYLVDIEKSKEVFFRFKVYDEASNIDIVDTSIFVEDIFEPTVEEIYVVLKNDLEKEIEFVIKDDIELKQYEISQNSITVSEEISGENFENKMLIPFKSGDILFKVIDTNNNSFSQIINLNSPFNNVFNSIYQNSEIFKFESNAEKCFLVNVNDKNYNDEFDKINNIFEINLNIPKNRMSEIEFYCIKNNFKEYYVKDFFYDTNPPQIIPEIDIEADEDGNLEIVWNESYDKESDVKYILYKDGKEIYDGTRLKYSDKDVLYPESYKYYLKVYDEALNSVKSKEVNEVPKKVYVNFQSNLFENMKVDNNEFELELKTDKNSDVDLLVKANQKIIFQTEFNNIENENLDIKFNLSEGVNEININIVDEFDNKFEKKFFINYEKIVFNNIENENIDELSVNTQETVSIQDDLAQNDIENQENFAQIEISDEDLNITQNNEEVEETGFNSNWIWFGIFFIIMIFFIWYFIFNEDKLREKYNKNKNTKRKNFPLFNVSRKKDNVLENSFDKIKNNRIKKQIERRKEVDRVNRLKEKESNRTELGSKKHLDLEKSKNSKVDFFNSKRDNKKKEDIRNIEKEDQLISKKEKEDKEKKTPINMFNRKEKEEIKTDDMSIYLRKIKQNQRSWSSTKDYLLSEQERKKKEKEDKIKAKEDEKRLLELEKNTKLKKIEEDRRKQEEREMQIKRKREGRDIIGKVDLDEYLKNRGKKNKNKFYFAEKQVNRDIRRK